MSINQTTDRQLLNQFYQNRDLLALEKFVARNRSKALQYASSFTDVDSAEDIVQISIIRLMNAEPVNREVSSAIAWWRSIVYSVAIDQLRSDRSRLTHESAAFDDVGLMEKEMDLEEDAIRTQFAQVVRNEIHSLQPKVRQVLLARYVSGLSYLEIAQSMQLSPGTVSTRLARGLEQIRQRLTAKGIIQQAASQRTQRSLVRGSIMKPLSAATKAANRRFAEKWCDLWAVSNQGIGRFTSEVHDDGLASIKWREDCPIGPSKHMKTEFPELVDERVWTENEILFTNADEFKWSRLQTRKAKVVGSEENLHQDYEILNSNNRLSISSHGQKLGVIDQETDSPIIINSLLPLLICEHDKHSSATWPVGLLGLLSEEARENSVTDWLVIPVQGRCAGKIGRPMDMGYLFEFGNEGSNMEITVLSDSTGQPKGFFWEAEGYVITEDERIARATYMASTN